MQTSVAIPSLCLLLSSLTAQTDSGKPLPAQRPAVDPNLKTEARFDPPKRPGDFYQPVAPVDSPQDAPAAAKSARTRVTTPRPTPDQVGMSEVAGALWARGHSYKAGFSAEGASLVPFFGAEAPRNYPIDFALRRVAVAGQDLAIAAKATVAQRGTQVRLERGPVVETWDLGPGSAEQGFVIAQLPQRGELRLQIAVTTELEASAMGDGLRFANDLGRVDYGAAVAIDAYGNRAAVTEHLSGGVLELTVPETFVASAALPITIDPLVQVTTPGVPGTVQRFADVAYDLSTDRFMITWEEVFSATDSDVHVQLLEADGSVVAGSIQYVDLSGVTWRRPRLANLRIPQRFLVAAEVGATGSRQVWSRTVEAAAFTGMGAPVQVSASASGENFNVDVGGDPSPASPTYWLVVWQRVFSSTDHDIFGQQVDANGNLHGPIILIDNTSNSVDTHPSVSKSDGDGNAATQEWIVVYQHTHNASDEDVYYARVRWDGMLLAPPAHLHSSVDNETLPAVSSVTDFRGAPRRWLAVYQYEYAADDHVIAGTLGDANGLYAATNLTMEDGRPAPRAQFQPHVDCDGTRFAVVCTERFGTNDYDTLAATFHDLGDRPFPSETRVGLGLTLGIERLPRICAQHSGGKASSERYAAVWDTSSGATDVLAAAAYDGHAPGVQLTMLATGCDGLGLTMNGAPLLGRLVSFQMQNVGANAPLVMFGLPYGPYAVCPPCGLGVDLSSATILPGAMLQVQIPFEGALVNSRVAVQGLTFGTGPCLSLVRTSPTALVNIR